MIPAQKVLCFGIIINRALTSSLIAFFSVPFKAYTDDTAMTFSVAQSLINKNQFDPQDMAKK